MKIKEGKMMLSSWNLSGKGHLNLNKWNAIVKEEIAEEMKSDIKNEA
jgi:hypothetical protein